MSESISPNVVYLRIFLPAAMSINWHWCQIATIILVFCLHRISQRCYVSRRFVTWWSVHPCPWSISIHSSLRCHSMPWTSPGLNFVRWILCRTWKSSHWFVNVCLGKRFNIWSTISFLVSNIYRWMWRPVTNVAWSYTFFSHPTKRIISDRWKFVFVKRYPIRSNTICNLCCSRLNGFRWSGEWIIGICIFGSENQSTTALAQLYENRTLCSPCFRINPQYASSNK